jgi:hypothetical protein
MTASIHMESAWLIVAIVHTLHTLHQLVLWWLGNPYFNAVLIISIVVLALPALAVPARPAVPACPSTALSASQVPRSPFHMPIIITPATFVLWIRLPWGARPRSIISVNFESVLHQAYYKYNAESVECSISKHNSTNVLNY